MYFADILLKGVMFYRQRIVAINSNGRIKGVVASVISVDQREETKINIKIPNISLMNNMEFKSSGVTFRKVYGIGNGYFVLFPKSYSKTMKYFKVSRYGILF